MNVIMRSDNDPDVLFEANESCRLGRLDQHIRTMQAARAWLKDELDRRKAPRGEAAAAKATEAVKK